MSIRTRKLTGQLLQATLVVTLILLATSTRPIQADSFALPDMGSSADTVMSIAEQRELGQEFMKWVRKTQRVSSDPLVTDYIQTLGRSLVESAGENPADYSFFIVEDGSINAFAGPSGNIGVNAGLILAAETEAELAAVVAHEIAHVSQKHLLRRFEAQQRMAAPTLAMMLAAVVLGATVDGDAGMAALAGTQGLAIQKQLDFSRANEEEADRIGIEALAKSGHDPYAMPGFFDKLSRASRIQQSGAPELLRTHPVTTDRIADALARAQQHGHQQRPDSLRFHLTRADLRQQAISNPNRAVDEIAIRLESGRYRSEIAERYGYALALLRANRPKEAQTQLRRLLAEHPSQVEFIILHARIDQRLGQPARAIEQLQSAAALSPASWPLQQAYAEALLDANRPQEALRVLERFIDYRKDLAPIYQLLSDAAGKSGQRIPALRWRAEALYLNGDLEPAIRQLELALKQPKVDFHLASRMQVRLAEWQEEQRRREAR